MQKLEETRKKIGRDRQKLGVDETCRGKNASILSSFAIFGWAFLGVYSICYLHRAELLLPLVSVDSWCV